MMLNAYAHNNRVVKSRMLRLCYHLTRNIQGGPKK